MIKDMKEKPGNKIQLQVPQSIYHRIRTLAINDEARSRERVPYYKKVLEALVTGVEALEAQERGLNE